MQVHDLVDNVTGESITAGRNAGLYALGKLARTTEHKVFAGNGIRYTVPCFYFEDGEDLEVFFRVTNKVRNAKIVVNMENTQIYSKFALALNPGEMSSIKIPKKDLKNDIEICVVEK